MLRRSYLIFSMALISVMCITGLARSAGPFELAAVKAPPGPFEVRPTSQPPYHDFIGAEYALDQLALKYIENEDIDRPGHPPLPTRLMAGLQILKYADDLSDEELCARWVENPYYQYFCGEEFFCHELPFDRSSMTRWRQRQGEERLQALLQESLAVAVKVGAAKPRDFTRAIVDTTVAEKNIAFPTDAKLIHRARERLVRQAQEAGIGLRQSYKRVGKYALIKHQRYAHAKQYKRAKRQLRKLKTYLRRTIRDIERKTKGNQVLEDAFLRPLWLARRRSVA